MNSRPGDDGSVRALMRRIPLWGYLVVALVVAIGLLPIILLVAVPLGVLAVEHASPGLIDTNTIRDEPYYGEVVGRITHDANFRHALGGVPVLHDREVGCSSNRTDGAIHQANCFFPVSGPRGKGEVHARIVDLPETEQIGLWLHFNGAVIDEAR